MGESERRWYCSHCENLNVKDENGDIVDPVVPSETLDPPYKVTTYKPYKLSKSKPELCDYCNNEQWIIQLLEKPFDLDENEKDYNQQVQQYLKRKRYLDERYGLCSECCKNVSKYLTEQDALYGKSRRVEPILDEQDKPLDDIYIVKESNRARSKAKTRTKAMLWTAAHVLTLMFFLYATYYPQAFPSNRLLHLDFFIISRWQEQLNVFFSHLKAGSYYYDLRSVFVCLVLEDEDCHTLSLTNGDCELFLFHLVSYYGCTWHPILYPWFNETHRFHYWKFYSGLQHVLFLFRTFLFVCPGFIVHRLHPKICAIVYIMMVVVPFFMITIRKGFERMYFPVNMRKIPAVNNDQMIKAEPIIEKTLPPPVIPQPTKPTQKTSDKSDLTLLRLTMRMKFMSLRDKKWTSS